MGCREKRKFTRIKCKCKLGFLLAICCASSIALFYVILRLLNKDETNNVFFGQTSGEGRKDIAVFVAVENYEDLKTEYRTAHRTLMCYCSMRGYLLAVMNMGQNSSMRRECPQNDPMFKRHCALALFLREHPDVKFALFLDADIAVINPSRSLDEYVGTAERSGIDMIFYERIFNGEIVAGSYFAKNSNFTIKMLHFWADYYYKLPWSWHGSDNGAIHAVFLDKFCGNKCSERRNLCMKLWKESQTDDGLRMFTDCARSILGNRNEFISSSYEEGKVLMLTDFRKYWTRDIWLTGSKWSPRDFLLHGLKKKWLNSTKWGGWKNPFLGDEGEFERRLDAKECLAGRKQTEWPYHLAYKREPEEVERILRGRVREMRQEQLDYWRRIEEHAGN